MQMLKVLLLDQSDFSVCCHAGQSLFLPAGRPS